MTGIFRNGGDGRKQKKLGRRVESRNGGGRLLNLAMKPGQRKAIWGRLNGGESEIPTESVAKSWGGVNSESIIEKGGWWIETPKVSV